MRMINIQVHTTSFTIIVMLIPIICVCMWCRLNQVTVESYKPRVIWLGIENLWVRQLLYTKIRMVETCKLL